LHDRRPQAGRAKFGTLGSNLEFFAKLEFLKSEDLFLGRRGGQQPRR